MFTGLGGGVAKEEGMTAEAPRRRGRGEGKEKGGYGWLCCWVLLTYRLVVNSRRWA